MVDAVAFLVIAMSGTGGANITASVVGISVALPMKIGSVSSICLTIDWTYVGGPFSRSCRR